MAVNEPFIWAAWVGQKIVSCKTYEYPNGGGSYTRIVLEDLRGCDFGPCLAHFTIKDLQVELEAK